MGSEVDVRRKKIISYYVDLEGGKEIPHSHQIPEVNFSYPMWQLMNYSHTPLILLLLYLLYLTW